MLAQVSWSMSSDWSDSLVCVDAPSYKENHSFTLCIWTVHNNMAKQLPSLYHLPFPPPLHPQSLALPAQEQVELVLWHNFSSTPTSSEKMLSMSLSLRVSEQAGKPCFNSQDTENTLRSTNLQLSVSRGECSTTQSGLVFHSLWR